MSTPSRKSGRLSSERLRLARALLEREGLAQGAGESIPRRAPDAGPAPLSFGQERLWFFDRMTPGSPVFNVPAAFRLRGPLDEERLRRALARLVERHETLRTRLGSEDGRPVQEVLPPPEPAEVALEVRSADDEARALELARDEARRPLDLARGPLYRVVLWRVSSGDGSPGGDPGGHHVLLVVLHHAVSEVQSVRVFVQDLAALDRALAGDAEPALPPLPIQFGDFAAWQRGRLAGERYEQGLAYWERVLGGRLPSLQLPTDRPRPAVQRFEGGTRTRALDPALAERLRELCRAERTTLFAAGLAAFSALLSRYGATEECLVGAPMTDRDRVEVEGLIGFFVQTLVLRCDLSGRPSFHELLARSREVCLGAQAHQDVPFEHLVERLQPERDLSRSPLFQVAYLFQNASEGLDRELALGGGATLEPLDDPLAVHTRTSKFDLSLILWDDGRGLSASFEYARHLFDAETVERMLGHLERLLAGMVAEPGRPVAELPLLTEAEERELAGWNDTAAEIPAACAHELFEAAADRAPDALAVASEEGRLTYRELEERANRLAHHLVRLGVGPDVPVGLLLERRLDLVVSVLAVTKAGGAYLPLDLAYPAERLAFMLADAGAPVLITHASLGERVPAHGGRTLRLDADRAAIAAEPATRPARRAGPHDLAYVIYTSGSTGLPKGVELEHEGLVNLTTWHQRTYGVVPADRATHLAGLAFDASVWELWPYLTAGASLFLVPEAVRLAPARLAAWLAERRITLAFLATPLAEALLAEELPRDLALRFLLTGGDKLHEAPPAGLPFRLVNHYGPTENTVVATACDVPPGVPAPPPIGRPIQNVRVHVLDAGGQKTPVGVPGELFVAGRSLARGYHGRPELTAERFPADPFPPAAGANGRPARAYATGDLVRWRADGQLEFLGRLDGQVKVRGFRIELGEIETVLARHEDVAEACCVIRHEEGEARLAAWVVPAEGAEPSLDALRSHLREALPEYMVPAALALLPELPLTPNGKVDRDALPEPDFTAGADAAFVAPEGPLEEAVARVWCELLGLERVSARANFFDVGGHSLLLARLQAALAPVTGELSIVELFQFPTVSALAAHVEARREPAPAAEELAPVADRAADRRARLSRRRARR